MNLKNYFNNNGGVFSALALFTGLMVLTATKSSEHFLGFSGFFISFVLICYLLHDLERIDSSWFGILFLGYNLLFISSFLFGLNNFSDMFQGKISSVIIWIIVGFYGYVNIRLFLRSIGVLK